MSYANKVIKNCMPLLDVLNGIRTVSPKKKCSRIIAPQIIASWMIAPWTIAPGKLSPRIIAHEESWPPDNSPR